MLETSNNTVICVGGSGAKCGEALVYLCAAGLGPEKLTLCFVDPDISNGNVRQALEAVAFYRALQPAESEKLICPLFRTEISVTEPSLWSPFSTATSEMSSANCRHFSDYFEYDSLKAHSETSDYALLVEALYPEPIRRLDLTNGFRGQPSVAAAILLDAITEDQAPWKQIISSSRTSLGIGGRTKAFLMGSGFGATGAAGISVIGRFLRASTDFSSNVSRTGLGAAMLLPYYSLARPSAFDSGLVEPPDPDSFLLMASDALDHCSQDGSFDAIYILGSDESTSTIGEFRSGGSKQLNVAHHIELLAALGAIDFLGAERPASPVIRTCTLNRPEAFGWSDVPNRREVQPAMADLARLAIFYVTVVNSRLDDLQSNRHLRTPWYQHYFVRRNVDVSQERTHYQQLDSFLRGFLRWFLDLCQTTKVELARADILLAACESRLPPRSFSGDICFEGPRRGLLGIPLMWERLCGQKVANMNALGHREIFMTALWMASKGDSLRA